MKNTKGTETRGALPLKFHIYAIIGCLIYTAGFDLLTRGKIFSDVFILTFLLMIVQVELFAWIGGKLLNSLIYNSVQEFIRKVIPRLCVFYFFVVIIAGLLFVGMTAIWSYSNGANLDLFFKQ